MDEEECLAAVRELVQGWFARSGTTTISQREDASVGIVVYGLVSHAHALARSFLVLHDAGEHAGAVPIARQILECCVTASWVEASGGAAAQSLLGEQSRQMRNVVREFLAAGIGDEASRTSAEAALGGLQHESGRRFEKRCAELDGGAIYATYRALSATSHASTSVVDLYAEPAAREVSPLGIALRHEPLADYGELLPGLVLTSLVPAGLAWARIDQDRHARSRLKELAAALGVTGRLSLSAEGLKAQRLREAALRGARQAR